MLLKVLIADDEPPARQNIAHLLSLAEPQALVCEAGNGIEAARLLGEFRPDLLFLDIQMPGLDGLDLMRFLPGEQRPVTVFVTAHRDFAVEAFDVAAADYLVKPFRRERFAEALRRARQKLAMPAPLSATGEAGPEPPASIHLGERLRIRDGKRHFFVFIDDIAWVSAAGNYVEIHTAEAAFLMRATMQEIQDLLPARRFVRIHRGFLVNRDGIREISATENGDYLVRLSGGQNLTMSRRRRQAVRELLGGDPHANGA